MLVEFVFKVHVCFKQMSYKSINLDFNVVLNYPMGAVDNTCADFLDGCGVVGLAEIITCGLRMSVCLSV